MLHEFLKSIKTARINELVSTKHDVTQPSLISDSVTFFDSRPVDRKIAVLRSNGCSWAQKVGCSMCGFFEETCYTGVTKDDYVQQIKSVFDSTDFTDVPVFCLFTAGSFLDPVEIPPEASQAIFREISYNKDIKKVLIESRPEFIKSDVIRELKEVLGGKTLEIGIGLETFSPEILSHCVVKGFTLPDYERAVKATDGLADVLTYVLLKPPFLTEMEAVQEAVGTVNYAFSVGSKAVSIEPMFITGHTLVEYLHSRGQYSLPWLWSLVEVLNQTYSPDRDIRVGICEEIPPPLDAAKNCDSCTSSIYSQLNKYNQFKDISLLDGMSCVCKSEWEKDLAFKDSRSVKDRIESFLSSHGS